MEAFSLDDLDWQNNPDPDIAGTLPARNSSGGGFGLDFSIAGGLQPLLLQNEKHLPHTVSEIRQAAQLLPEQSVSHTLRGVGADASEDGTGRGRPFAAQVYSLSVAHRSSNGWGVNEDCAFTLDCSGPSAVAVALRGRDGVGVAELGGEQAHALRSSQGGGDKALILTIAALPKRVSFIWIVRYLTPRECERLQGIPDDHTLIPWRRGLASDSVRYKAVGNGMAVPCVAWLLQRIDFFHHSKTAAPCRRGH